MPAVLVRFGLRTTSQHEPRAHLRNRNLSFTMSLSTGSSTCKHLPYNPQRLAGLAALTSTCFIRWMLASKRFSRVCLEPCSGFASKASSSLLSTSSSPGAATAPPAGLQRSILHRSGGTHPLLSCCVGCMRIAWSVSSVYRCYMACAPCVMLQAHHFTPICVPLLFRSRRQLHGLRHSQPQDCTNSSVFASVPTTNNASIARPLHDCQYSVESQKMGSKQRIGGIQAPSVFCRGLNPMRLRL